MNLLVGKPFKQDDQLRQVLYVKNSCSMLRLHVHQVQTLTGKPRVLRLCVQQVYVCVYIVALHFITLK